VKANEETSTQSSQFQMDSTMIASIVDKSNDAELIFESQNGKLLLPVKSLASLISQDSAEQKIVITITQAPSDYKTKLNAQLNSSTSTSLGNPVDFEIRLTGTGEDRMLSTFSEYVDHTLNYEVSEEA